MEFGIKTNTYVKRTESPEINPHTYGTRAHTHTHTLLMTKQPRVNNGKRTVSLTYGVENIEQPYAKE